MEYGHRMWGRAFGAVFLIPAAIFWARGWFKPGMKKRIFAFGTLIALQVVFSAYLTQNTSQPRGSCWKVKLLTLIATYSFVYETSTEMFEVIRSGFKEVFLSYVESVSGIVYFLRGC